MELFLLIIAILIGIIMMWLSARDTNKQFGKYSSWAKRSRKFR
ncbi:MAG: hypothetical protein U0T73_03600 [Chitinophagales bacterium]